MNYRLVHRTTYTYGGKAELCHNEARLTPRALQGQQCADSRIEIAPQRRAPPRQAAAAPPRERDVSELASAARDRARRKARKAEADAPRPVVAEAETSDDEEAAVSVASSSLRIPARPLIDDDDDDDDAFELDLRAVAAQRPPRPAVQSNGSWDSPPASEVAGASRVPTQYF